VARLIQRHWRWYSKVCVHDRASRRYSNLARSRRDRHALGFQRLGREGGSFSAGDLMMVSVLLRLKLSGMLDAYPNRLAFVARGEVRSAYQRAFDAQLAVFNSC
jgi:glutathione S-transferase